MAEHRVPMLSPSLHRFPDPERSPDPRVRALVGQLGTLEAPSPHPDFRAELRAQLVAITPRIVAEGEGATAVPRRRPSPVPRAAEPVAPARRQPSRARARLARIGQLNVGKPLAVLTCVIAVFAVLLGGAVWISKRALPGDALYGLKRAGENLQEAMAGSDTDKAKLFLRFADTRYAEVADLVPAHSSGAAVDGHTASLISSTLDSADSDVRNAMQDLGAQAIRSANGTGLGLVTQWAVGPQRTLQQIVGRLPAGTAHQRVASSLALLSAADARAAALKRLGACSCLASARTDSLGAVPCSHCSSAGATLPNTTHSSAPAGTHRSSVSGTNGGGARAPGNGVATTSGAAPSSAQPNSSTAPAPSGSSTPLLPPLPVGSVPNLPGNTPSSCAGVQLGPISIGNCGVRLGGS